MSTIVIPGYSHKNKEWAEETRDKLKVRGIEAETYEWKHWNDPTVKFNAKAEAGNIKAIIGDKLVDLVAKSIGTLVVAILLKELKVNKVIFCGIPVNDVNEDDLHEYKILSDIDPKKILVFQNSEDEHGTFEGVRKFLSQINPNIKIIEKPGSTHDYPYYEEFMEFLGQE